MKIKIYKPRFWQKKKSLFSLFLLPLSFFFQLLFILSKNLKKKKKFTIPVICVGNIYIGGTGKTPLSIELYNILKKFNKKTAVIKKFYSAHEDEFKLIESKKIKLFKGTSRAIAIKKAEAEKFDCVILDDGFQDTSIIKSLSIVCFNGDQLAGNGMTLPSGPLREPLSSLENSQIAVINGEANDVFEKELKIAAKDISIYYSKYLPTNLDQFTDQNLLAFAGIGNPNGFFNLLKKSGLKISKEISFPDHYNYPLKELNNLVEYSIANNLKIITTEKDYFRIKHYNISQIQYLTIKLEIKNKNKFQKELMKCFL